MLVFRCDQCASEVPRGGLRCYASGPSIIITPMKKSYKQGDKDQHFCSLACLTRKHPWLVSESVKEASNEQ